MDWNRKKIETPGPEVILAECSLGVEGQDVGDPEV